MSAVQVSEHWQHVYAENSVVAGVAPGVLGLTYSPVAITSLPTDLGYRSLRRQVTRAVNNESANWLLVPCRAGRPSMALLARSLLPTGLGDCDLDRLGHDRGVMRHVVVVAEQQLKCVGAERKR